MASFPLEYERICVQTGGYGEGGEGVKGILWYTTKREIQGRTNRLEVSVSRLFMSRPRVTYSIPIAS
eukprot:760116-Hanusia_phi.AAC.1